MSDTQLDKLINTAVFNSGAYLREPAYAKHPDRLAFSDQVMLAQVKALIAKV